jgi:AbiV family abortive infection protein
MAGLAFQNALRFHFDAIRLYKMHSYASALALSVLSMEELSKANDLEDIGWYALVDGVPIQDLWNLEKNFYNHKLKQLGFASRITLHSMPRSSLWKIAASGELEKIKQDALYVGISGNKSPAVPGARVKNPLTISPKKSGKYITLVNDFLLDLTIGELGGWYGVDAESIEKQLTRMLVYRLIRSWPKRGRVGKRALRLYPEIEIEDD